jgi:hypothetical protein
VVAIRDDQPYESTTAYHHRFAAFFLFASNIVAALTATSATA